MKDVAKAAGVSISSVSHVLNGTRFVSEDVVRKVEEASRDLHYTPNPIAQNLRKGKSGLIGFIVSNLENSLYVRITKGIEKTINSFGYRLLLIDSVESKKKEMENVESLCLRGVDGLIIVPTTPDCGYLEEIVRQNYPIVFIDRQPSNWDADVVLLDNEEASYEATKKFIAQGIREIGLVAIQFGDDDNDFVINERVSGYKKALAEAHIPYRRQYLKISTSPPATFNELRHSSAFKMTEQLLKTRVSAILSGNNYSAIGIYSCLREHHIRIPDDIAMITFDDDLWLQMNTPSISAMAQPAEELGKLAAKRLIIRLLQQQDLPKEQFRLKAQFIPRESSLLTRKRL
ncbi:MAG: LacI family transcriptional regulator [Spirochaetaceae bacterium]|nr:LacI family transcriptional regulator [Spirochaetaceae bacterium]